MMRYPSGIEEPLVMSYWSEEWLHKDYWLSLVLQRRGSSLSSTMFPDMNLLNVMMLTDLVDAFRDKFVGVIAKALVHYKFGRRSKV